MAFLHNISSVAVYEAKTLRRSWFFRLFSIGALLIFTFMNIGVFSPVGDEDWELIANPASLPLINLYLLNIGQAIVVIFLAADFLKRDKKVDTNEVLYTRSMSNLEYVMGKTFGILRLFLGLNLLILAIGLTINIISKSMSVDIVAYLEYILIISVPTLVFSLGLAFMLMSLIRNQAVTFLLLLGVAVLNMFWLWHRMGSIFDYMAFGLPVFKSEVTGFGNITGILYQRGLFLSLGITFILATVLLFKRLPQSKHHTVLAASFMLIFLAAGFFSGYKTYMIYKTDLNEKASAIAANSEYENRAFARLTAADISLEHKGKTIEARALLTISNLSSEYIGSYIFSLNPYLSVNGVSYHGRDLSFTRKAGIIEIDPGKQLKPGESDSLEISYSGSIDESYCYPDYDDNIKETPYRIAMVNVQKRQAFLDDNYVLLTPESFWYPVPGLNYYPSNPARIKIDFTKFSLKVTTKDELVAVSQGSMSKNEGIYDFTPKQPLSGLTLAIGNYGSDTIRVDSVDYISFYFKGHDYYKKDLSELGDTLPNLVSVIMRELETNFSTRYPFNTLSLVEVPVHFYSYPRLNTQTRAELQPSMVLLPEKMSTIQNAGFYKQFARQKKRNARNNQVITDKELQVRILMSFIRNTFISGENFRYINGVVLNEPTRYRLGPSFYFFKNNFYSDEYPVINAVFESHLQRVTPPQGNVRQMQGNLTENDRANLILKNASFREILKMNPGSDTIRSVVSVKGDYLFNLIRSKTGINEFTEWFVPYLDANKFKSVDIRSFNNDLNKEFGVEFYSYLESWFNKKDQPGFILTDLRANEIVVNDRVRYLVSFLAYNPEPVAGIFNVSVQAGGPGGGQVAITMTGPASGGRGMMTISSQGRGMEASDLSRIVVLGPGEASQVRIILDRAPRMLLINTLFSRNIPGEIVLPVEDIVRLKTRDIPAEGVFTSDAPPRLSESNELIVDNEDPGFNDGNIGEQSPLKKLLGVRSRRTDTYEQINYFWAPEYWQKVAQSVYYGRYVRSSVVTRAGTGDRSVSWNARTDGPGYYDIYCYIGKEDNRITVRTGTGPQGPPPPGSDRAEVPIRDLHYRIHHDEGMDEITVDFETADPGWNNLGRYYLSADSAKVELTNQSEGRIVIGDAIRWVKVY